MDEEMPLLSIAIDKFFTRCGLHPEARFDCHNFLENHFPGRTIEAAQTQGYCSYTVLIDHHVIQFRPPGYRLDLDIITMAKRIHGLYVPATIQLATLEPSGLLVYKMEKIAGISYKGFRTTERLPATAARQQLCEDFAVFLAQSWHAENKQLFPRGKIGSSICSRLEKLSIELPLRFKTLVNDILSRLAEIETSRWVLTHGDIVPSNIMLNPTTGHLCGLVDWAEAEFLPFGVCLYGLEEILGYMVDGKFVYHADAEQARAAFWCKMVEKIPELSQSSTLEVVFLGRDLGILLWHGFAFDDGAIDRVVQEGKDVEDICYLDAMLGLSRLELQTPQICMEIIV